MTTKPRCIVGNRVAVTRDESFEGPLSKALRSFGLEPVLCPAVRQAPAGDVWKLQDAARHLERYDWLVVASRRAVLTLMEASGETRLPAHLRTAAVGASTAVALTEFGAKDPVTAQRAGAEALAETLLAAETWLGKGVLLPRAEGGSRLLAEALAAAGATVEEIDAYRTIAIEPERLAGSWMRSAPHAAVVASPSAAHSLIDAIGAAVLNQALVIAIGPTTAAALASLGVESRTAKRADWMSAAELTAQALGLRSTPATPHDCNDTATSKPGGAS